MLLCATVIAAQIKPPEKARELSHVTNNKHQRTKLGRTGGVSASPDADDRTGAWLVDILHGLHAHFKLFNIQIQIPG